MLFSFLVTQNSARVKIHGTEILAYYNTCHGSVPLSKMRGEVVGWTELATYIRGYGHPEFVLNTFKMVHSEVILTYVHGYREETNALLQGSSM